MVFKIIWLQLSSFEFHQTVDFGAYSIWLRGHTLSSFKFYGYIIVMMELERRLFELNEDNLFAYFA